MVAPFRRLLPYPLLKTSIASKATGKRFGIAQIKRTDDLLDLFSVVGAFNKETAIWGPANQLHVSRQNQSALHIGDADDFIIFVLIRI